MRHFTVGILEGQHSAPQGQHGAHEGQHGAHKRQHGAHERQHGAAPCYKWLDETLYIVELAYVKCFFINFDCKKNKYKISL